MNRRFHDGFTLIEVMVALIIFAVLSVTLLVRLGDNIRSEQYLESKTVANIVAENALTELRIKEDWSAVRNSNKVVNMAGQDWQVKIIVTDTKIENLRKVDVQVGPDSHSRENRSIVTLSTMIGRD